MLRGQKVLAKATADGRLAADSGRVEIRYKPNDGRAYRAAAANLVVVEGAAILSDDHCAPAGPAPAPSAKKATDVAHAHATSTTTAGRFIAYTDGACSGNPGPAGAGMIVILPDGKMHEGYEYLGEGTNNIAELTAVLRAVEAMPPNATDIVVYTDSQYAIGVLTKGWKAKANQELVAKAKSTVAARRARLVYVPGHAGVPLNERADELAREAIRTRTTKAVATSKRDE